MPSTTAPRNLFWRIDMADNRPIGVFDSGIGGLTAVKELRAILPNEDIIYLGDTARVPYGTRGEETIIRYAKEDIAFLQAQNVKLIIAACGTVSSVAGSVIDACDTLATGVIIPAATAAMAATENGRIGIIGTPATVKSKSYESYIASSGDYEVYAKACPMFVPLVENGFITPQDVVTRLVAERYLAPIREKGIDTLILGCTHYPIIAPTIRSVMGRNVTLIDAGREAAAGCFEVLSANGLLCTPEREPEYRFYVSDEPQQFYHVADLFLGHSVKGKVERIDIEKY